MKPADKPEDAAGVQKLKKRTNQLPAYPEWRLTVPYIRLDDHYFAGKCLPITAFYIINIKSGKKIIPSEE